MNFQTDWAQKERYFLFEVFYLGGLEAGWDWGSQHMSIFKAREKLKGQLAISIPARRCPALSFSTPSCTGCPTHSVEVPEGLTSNPCSRDCGDAQA